jgi:hypothetical protein
MLFNDEDTADTARRQGTGIVRNIGAVSATVQMPRRIDQPPNNGSSAEM